MCLWRAGKPAKGISRKDAKTQRKPEYRICFVSSFAPLRLCVSNFSSVPPNSLTLLQKSPHTLIRVLSLHQLVQVNIFLLAQRVLERTSASEVQRLSRERQRRPRKLPQLRQHLQQFRFKMSAGHHVVAQTQSPRLHRIDDLARQNQLARPFFADHTRQKHCRDRRKYAQLYLRLPETRAV